MTKPITPTLVVCAAAALIAGLALARPGGPVTASSAPVETIYPSDEAAAGDQSATAAIEIVDFDFAGDLTVVADQPITVSNADSSPHTLTAVDDEFDSSVIDGGGTGQITAPASAGDYEFFCAIHPSMSGTLTVTP